MLLFILYSSSQFFFHSQNILMNAKTRASSIPSVFRLRSYNPDINIILQQDSVSVRKGKFDHPLFCCSFFIASKSVVPIFFPRSSFMTEMAFPGVWSSMLSNPGITCTQAAPTIFSPLRYKYNDPLLGSQNFGYKPAMPLVG